MLVTAALDRRRSRATLFAGASLATLIAIALPSSVAAQAVAQPSADAVDSSEAKADIVVTGTRVVRDGYKAPTPTTVLGAADIAAKAPTLIADYVNTLPALAGSTTPRTSIAALSTGAAGLNALNLRNLGVNRTLVLLDGQRVGASSLEGLVDINQFPTALIKRVDIVTGGASAGWGSDAVAGVVNFVINKEFTGLMGEAQGGVTTYGDDRTYKVALSAGTKLLDDRLHLLVSGEAAYNAGTNGLGDRKWYTATKFFNNPAYTPTNGQPALIVRPNAGFATATPGGIITSGPLRGIHFGANGVPLQFNYGSVVSGMYMAGGDAAYADWGSSGDLDPELARQSVFARSSFDITDRFQVFASLTYARARSHVAFGNQYNYGNLTIRSDNAFLPASVAAQAAALGVTSFSLGSLNEDLGPIEFSSKRHSWRPVVGAKGNFDAFGSNWTWDVYAQRSTTQSYSEVFTTITPNYNAAIDSVRTSNGQIVCRSTLTNPGNGCVPYNIFGTGVNNQAALNYVKGRAWLRSKIKEDVAAANLRGNPFSTWAGPISVALGVEHRRESVTGTNDPLSPARSYWAGNYNASRGAYSVNEGYFETVVPLAKDSSFADSLDLNGSVRATSYSTSGFVTTWKVGLTYSPIKDVTFRATRSRDIRAPNLAELFQGQQTATSTISDPFNGNSSVTAFQVTSGNSVLKPERADSYGFGIVLQPRFLPGFATSLDFYNIEIKDAITAITAQVLVNQCFTGNTAFCGSIVRNGAGAIATVNVRPVNLAKQVARGLDFEASYRRHIGDGNLTLRFLATRYIKNFFNNGINVPTDTVGTNYARGSAAGSLPKLSYNASIAWEGSKLGLFLSARGFSSGVYDTSYIQCTSGCPTSTTANMTIDNNHLPGAVYFDTNISYKVLKSLEAFVSIDNILNKDPGTVGWNSGGSPLDTNQALYDALGRRFRVGIRFKM